MGAASRRLVAILCASWRRSRSAYWRARNQQLVLHPARKRWDPAVPRRGANAAGLRHTQAVPWMLARGWTPVPKHQNPLAPRQSGPAGKILQCRATRELCNWVGSRLLGSNSHSQIIPSRSAKLTQVCGRCNSRTLPDEKVY